MRALMESLSAQHPITRLTAQGGPRRMNTIQNSYWHIFDQVLLRPSLIKYFEHENLKILTDIGGEGLMRKHKLKHEISDHLPIVVEIKSEQG
jgi:hypothetical protein